jgi:ribose 5-phosphate isomerase B
MTIAVGTDHRGIKLKEKIVVRLLARRYKIKDFGAFSEEPVDYPAYAFKVGECVARKKARFGILLCHTGNGMAIAANKIPGVRAAICPDRVFAGFARRHNDANVLVIPAGFVKAPAVTRIIDIFLKTGFEGGRHRRRVLQIRSYERGHGK